MSNNSITMRDIQEAREAIAAAQQKPLNGVHLTRGEFGSICAGFVALERQVKTLQDDNRQLMEQIEAGGREMPLACESCAVMALD